MDELVMALTLFSLVQFWMWLFLFMKVGKRLKVLENKVIGPSGNEEVESVKKAISDVK